MILWISCGWTTSFFCLFDVGTTKTKLANNPKVNDLDANSRKFSLLMYNYVTYQLNICFRCTLLCSGYILIGFFWHIYLCPLGLLHGHWAMIWLLNASEVTLMYTGKSTGNEPQQSASKRDTGDISLVVLYLESHLELSGLVRRSVWIWKISHARHIFCCVSSMIKKTQ